MDQFKSPPSSAFTGLIGLARINVTPPPGIYCRNWGAAKHDVASSVHRPLTLGAIVFQSASAKGPLVLVETDLCTWSSLSLFREFQSQILTEFKLDESQLIFSLTHTHAAPRPLHEISDLPGAELARNWTSTLQTAALQAVRTAIETQSECCIEWHRGACQLAAQRDLNIASTDSEPDYLCGYNPVQKADDTLLVGRITTADGKALGTIINYACHPTTLAWDCDAISPDFVGAARETVSRATDAPVFFLQGTSGELAPKEQYVGDPAVADRHGRQLGYSVLATLEDMLPPNTEIVFDSAMESGARLGVWKRQSKTSSQVLAARTVCVELQLKEQSTEAELDHLIAHCEDRTMQERYRRRRDVRIKLGSGDTYSLPVHAWRIGDAILVGTMTEAYSNFQLELREAFPDQHIVCMNLINGSIGYLPPESIYDTNIYQVWQSPFVRNSLEKVIATAKDLIADLLKTSSTRAS